MSNPSFSNIDQWFFELQEGNLSPEQVAQLKSFVIQHPELDVDKDMWELASVESTPLYYQKKDTLIRKRPIAFYWAITSAASVLLVIGFITFFSSQEKSVSNYNVRTEITSFNRLNTNTHSDLASTNHHSSVSIEQQLSNSIVESPIFGLHSTISFTNQNSILNESSLSVNNTIGYSDELNQAIEQNQKFNRDTKQEVLLALATKTNYNLNELKREQIIALETEEEEIEDWKLHRKSASNSYNSFSAKMRRLQRTIERMVDNPIALKNLKDPHYHVPGMQAVDINFGAVGTLLATRVQTTSRYQWMGNQNEQLSNQLLVDGYAYAIRGGVGLQVIQSNYHDNSIQETFAAITYSPKFSVSKNVTVEPAIRYKMGNSRIDPKALKPGQSVEFERNNAKQFYSSTETPIGKSLWFKDIGMSVMVNTKWFFAGAQFDNLARHENNLYSSNSNERSSIHSVFTLGTDYESVNKNLRFSPYLIYQNYGKLSEAWLGTNFGIKWFNVGAAISSNIEPAASIGVKFKQFAVTYNADYTRSMMTSKNALSHQLTLRFNTKPSRVGQRLLNY